MVIDWVGKSPQSLFEHFNRVWPFFEWFSIGGKKWPDKRKNGGRIHGVAAQTRGKKENAKDSHKKRTDHKTQLRINKVFRMFSGTVLNLAAIKRGHFELFLGLYYAVVISARFAMKTQRPERNACLMMGFDDRPTIWLPFPNIGRSLKHFLGYISCTIRKRVMFCGNVSDIMHSEVSEAPVHILIFCLGSFCSKADSRIVMQIISPPSSWWRGKLPAARSL